MSCPESELLSAFADGAIDAVAGAEVKRHLSTCVSCRERVEEMCWVDALGRSSLRAIRLVPASKPTVLRARPTSSRLFLRPIAFAAAAVAIILVCFAAWRLDDRFRETPRVSTPSQRDPDSARSGQNQGKTETGALMDSSVFNGSPDEAFEHWVEPYRRLQIPLIPMERLSNFNMGTVPIEPAATKRNGAG
jgi:hypothetical protein